MSKRILTEFRRKYLRFQTAEKRRLLKLEAIKYKGGKCSQCGYDKCPGALDFHHIDPSTKLFGIAFKGRSHKNLNAIKDELDKCVLLCKNCHAEDHAAENEIKRLAKLEEINKEKREWDISQIKNCSYCDKEISVFNSRLKENNFCSVECKRNFFHEKDWPSDEELLVLKSNFSVKEMANNLNKSLSNVYDRLSKIKIK